jgi:hypothetical protein
MSHNDELRALPTPETFNVRDDGLGFRMSSTADGTGEWVRTRDHAVIVQALHRRIDILTTPPAATRAVDAKTSAALSRLERNEYGDPRTAAANRSRDIATVRAALHQAAPDAQGAVDDAMVERAERVRVKTLNKLTAYGSAGVAERHQMAMHAALEAALTPPTGGPA